MENFEHTSTRLKEDFKVAISSNEVQILKSLVDRMPQEIRAHFKKRYGEILPLLSIPMQTSALSVLAQYWNPTLRCFELPNLDFTPTIEEYACMLDLPLKKDQVVYFRVDNRPSEACLIRQMGCLLGMEVEQLKVVGHADSRGISRACLEKRLSNLAHLNEWGAFSKTLALLIYGLVLFPSGKDMIDLAAMDVFYTVEEMGRNPVPAILAETFLTLSFCKEERKGKLRCCLQLLYVWVMSHMYAGRHIDHRARALEDFCDIPIKLRDEYEWKVEFDDAEAEPFKWVCPWYARRRGVSIIFSCGNFQNVPLIGPRGCIAYTPSLVIRQFGWIQTMPREEQLGGVRFMYKNEVDTRKFLHEVREAWGNIRLAGKGELGDLLTANSDAYMAWRASRGIRGLAPTRPPLKRPLSTGRLEMLETLTNSLKEQKEDAYIALEIERGKNEKLLRRLKLLEDESAKASRTIKGMEKEAETSSAKIMRSEARVRYLTSENYKLAVAWKDQEDLAKAEKQACEEAEMKSFVEAQEHAEEIEKLKGSLEKLNYVLDHTIIERDQLNAKLLQAKEDQEALYAQYVESRDQCVTWGVKAIELEEKNVVLQKKLDMVRDRLTTWGPEFLRRFCEADEEMRSNPFWEPLPAVGEFMSLCGCMASGLKRKRDQ